MAGKKQDRSHAFDKRARALHKKLGGKIGVHTKGKLKTNDDWSLMYTPGVAAVSAHLADHPEDARTYTMKRNTVAVVSDGSAVLGLGDIGPAAALPVMEGKCAIFKELAGIDAFPIVLDAPEAEDIIETVCAIAPVFGGINLEDIAAPKCFAIEEHLKRELDIPVMHDDQHGTAVVVLAGLINAAKVVKKQLTGLRVAIIGAGAAGRATALVLREAGIADVVVTDSKGVLHVGRDDLKHGASYKRELAEMTNPRGVDGSVLEAVMGADVLIGVSGPGTITKKHVSLMADNAIVFALANPIPEIMPEEAKAAGAKVIATGRSDFPNQVNNSLAFPGIFRGALDRGVRDITDEMKVKAAKKIASMIKNPTPANIIPKNTTKGLVQTVASAIR